MEPEKKPKLTKDRFKEFIVDVLNYDGVLRYLFEIKQEHPRLFEDFAKKVEKVADSTIIEDLTKYKRLDCFVRS